MVKTKIKLYKVLEYQDLLEKEIKHTIDNIIRLSKSKKPISELEDTLAKLQSQLLIVKEVKLSANKKKHSIFGKTNEYYIHRLTSVKQLLNLYDSIYKNGDFKDKHKNLLRERDSINEKLLQFNNSTDVKIEIDPTLAILK